MRALPAAKLAVEGRETGLQFGNAFPEAPVVVEEKLDFVAAEMVATLGTLAAEWCRRSDGV